MTTITFGGGPTTDARRQFSNLKSGSQVPGYIGYIHQLKYNSGHTYGSHTQTLADKFPQFARSQTDIESEKPLDNCDRNLPLELRPKAKFALTHQLPKAISGNKLTDSMVPGYTGYIPSRKFHFSDTYRAECDQCIDSFITEKERKSAKINNLLSVTNSYERHKNIAPNSEIKKHMDYYRDNHPNEMSLQADKREFTEPPLPGYTGYAVKIKPTELGLGERYHETTRKGFEAFKNEYSRNKRMIDGSTYGSLDRVTLNKRLNTNDKRIYLDFGMVPKYTGYVHGLKYQFGNTYGEATRQLPVCNHKSQNFSTYLEENPNKTVVC